MTDHEAAGGENGGGRGAFPPYVFLWERLNGRFLSCIQPLRNEFAECPTGVKEVLPMCERERKAEARPTFQWLKEKYQISWYSEESLILHFGHLE